MTTQHQIATRLNALKQRAAIPEQTNHWKPVVGETIAGVIVGMGSFNHRLYGLQRTVLLETEIGVVSVITSKYIQKAFENQNAEQGDLCAITFQGQGVSNGHKFNKYAVIVEKMDVSHE